MHPTAHRVVYDNRPYLFVAGSDSRAARVYGPFDPGTEPSLKQCTQDHQIDDRELIETLRTLLPRSPELPSSADTLAGG